MLNHPDLATFVSLAQHPELVSVDATVKPDEVLRPDLEIVGLWHQNEVAQLLNSVKIAYHAGDVPLSIYHILYTIKGNLSSDKNTYLPVFYAEEWLRAIAWARAHLIAFDHSSIPFQGKDRQWVVGNSCRSLREQGYHVEIGAVGPRIDPENTHQIALEVDSLIAQLGGTFTIRRLFEFLRRNGKLHDGMWLFGNVPTPTDQIPEPGIPMGWLFSIALKYLNKGSSTLDSEKVWNSAVNLAVNFAAIHDCQRYERFEGYQLSPVDFIREITNSLVWRELFTLPQVPPSILNTLRIAFSQIDWPKNSVPIRELVDELFGELERVLCYVRENDLSLMPTSFIRSAFPQLWKYSRAIEGRVNVGYFDPFGTCARNHDRFIFFGRGDGRTVLLPSALTAAAACETIFRTLWCLADTHDAEKIVGATFEKCVAIACRKHSDRVFENKQYSVADSNLELDVAVRESQQVFLFEIKAKSLTSKSRLGDISAFLRDYNDSFLALLKQLARHDWNINRGLIPELKSEVISNEARTIKVAVSPLCYGPVSDAVWMNSLIGSISDARFKPMGQDQEYGAVLQDFNKSIEDVNKLVCQILGKQSNGVELAEYVQQVYWMDLGQLLYVLNRGCSLLSSLSVFDPLTFSSRDFWTEVALADIEGVTEQKWHPVSRTGQLNHSQRHNL